MNLYHSSRLVFDNTEKVVYMETKPSSVPHILKIEWLDEDDDLYNTVTLLIDNKTLFNLQANPVEAELKGWPLVEALSRRGALINDTIDPSGERRGGWQAFDLQSGKRAFLGHLQAGEYQDTASGEPAMQTFDRRTGNLIELSHYQAGTRGDPASGDPALQKFNPETGRLTYAGRFVNGRSAGALSADELHSFEAAGNRKLSLPENLLIYRASDLRPAA